MAAPTSSTTFQSLSSESLRSKLARLSASGADGAACGVRAPPGTGAFFEDFGTVAKLDEDDFNTVLLTKASGAASSSCREVECSYSGSTSSPSSSASERRCPDPELAEVMRELERLEHTLVEERERKAQLLEAKQAGDEAHARDVAMLEGMLEQALAENEALSKQLKALQQDRKCVSESPARPLGALDGTNNSTVTVSTACSVGLSSVGASPTQGSPQCGLSSVGSMPSWSNVSSHPQEFEEPEVEPCRRWAP